MARKTLPSATVARLYDELAQANLELSNAKAHKAGVVAELVAVTKFNSDGQASYQVPVGDRLGGFTLKQNTSVTIDESGIGQLRKDIGRGTVARLFKTRHELKMPEARKLREEDKVAWAAVSNVVTIKDTSVSVVDIKFLGEEDSK